MTVIEAINRIDALKLNTFGPSEKVKWLSELDAIVKSEIIDAHEGADKVEFSEYTEEDLTRELLIPSPYDRVYIHWLESKIDYWSNELKRYNNSAATFNAAYESYARHYVENHKPIGRGTRFVF